MPRPSKRQITRTDVFSGRDLIRDVEQFYTKFGHKPLHKPGFLSPEDMAFRLSFQTEETQELYEAYRKKDLTEMYDALLDIVYVALGTLHLMGFATAVGWEEVHTSNMEKVPASEENPSKRGHPKDIVKPKGWEKPNLECVISETIRVIEEEHAMKGPKHAE